MHWTCWLIIPSIHNAVGWYLILEFLSFVLACCFAWACGANDWVNFSPFYYSAETNSVVRYVNSIPWESRLHTYTLSCTLHSLFTIAMSCYIRFLVSNTSFQRIFLRNYLFVCLNRNESGSRWQILGSCGVSTQLRRKQSMKF